MLLAFAPGASAVIRDEEWLIRQVNPSVDGGWLLTCDGISELVRSQSSLFLTLENAIEGLDPADIRLVPTTPGPATRAKSPAVLKPLSSVPAGWLANPDIPCKRVHMTRTSYLLSFPYADENELVGDIMRFGPNVQFLAPPSLHSKV